MYNRKVSWAYMRYEACIQNGLVEEILRHTADLPAGRREDYQKYLVSMAGFPKSLFESGV